VKTWAATILLLSAGLLTAGRAAAETEPDSLAAQYDYKTWDCTVKGNELTAVVRYRVTIFNKRGLKHGSVWLAESPFVKLKRFRGVMYDVEGKELTSRTKGDCEKYCGYARVPIYSDLCHYVTEFQTQTFPYSVEVEYEEELKSLFFWRREVFQEDVPVVHCSYRLSIEDDSPFQYKVYGAEITPSVAQDGDRLRYDWSIDSLPARDDLDWAPPGRNDPVSIRFCPEKCKLGGYELEGCEWSAIGEWYATLCRERMLDGALDNPAGSTGAALAVVDSLYSAVQRDIRYVAIDVGIGGWQPHNAQATLEHGYGDCKDMSNVLVSQLRLNGVTAYPVLLLTRNAGLTDTTFPGDDFNHVITMAVLGQDTVWMDPTCDNCPLGELPTADQQIPVLVVTEEGGKIRTTAASDWNDNRTVRTTRWILEPSLYARMTTELSVTGAYARYLRNALEGLNSDETRRLVDRQFRGAPKKYTIKNFEFENLDDIHKPLVIKATGRTTRPARRLGEVVYFNPFLQCGLNSIETTDLSERASPLYMVYPELVQDTITVRWDSLSVDSVSIPDDDSISYACGHFILKTAREPDGVRCEIAKACYAFSVDTAYFDEFKKYRGHVKKTLDQYVKLVEKSL